jgi:hypothetical protein
VALRRSLPSIQFLNANRVDLSIMLRYRNFEGSMKKNLLLVLAGSMAIVSVLLAFAPIPTGYKNIFVSQPFSGGVWNRNLSIKDALNVLEASQTIMSWVMGLTIAFAVSAVTLFALHFIFKKKRAARTTSIAVASLKLCPFCAEDVQSQAIVCRHCGKDLPPND